MEFLISESQLKMILMEQDGSKISTYMRQLSSFTNDIVNRTIKNYGINLKMLLTWGTSVGGLMMPLDNWIKEGNFNLTDEQTALVLSGVAFILFFQGRTGIKTIMKKIKEEGIENEFNAVLSKTKKLKIAFEEFLWSLNFSMGVALDTVAYSFLIPIITDIYQVAIRTSNITESVALIVERLVASGVVLISSQILSKVIKKIVERIR
jgi:hypothetical protein